jgi:hypothetical protein
MRKFAISYCEKTGADKQFHATLPPQKNKLLMKNDLGVYPA